MTPRLEAMGIRMLFNECEPIVRGDQTIYLAGIDDPHFYQTDDIKKAAASIPKGAFSVLLSHSPETYAQAEDEGFALMLAGHTHGGQLCLPGGVAIKLEAVLPRRMGAGAWRHKKLSGYTSTGAGTSLLPVRLNCPVWMLQPERDTLFRHHPGAQPWTAAGSRHWSDKPIPHVTRATPRA
jgi:predicted MPP superfamily phosphohydrolase